MKAIACSKSVPPGTHARHGLHTPEGGLAHRGLGNLIPRTTRRSQKHDVPFSQHFFAIDANVRSAMHTSGSRKSAGSQSSTREASPFGSTSALFLGCKMWADPQYLTSWRDLRRRELLFWFFVLSYVPGILLIIIIVNVFEHDAPEHIGMYFSGAWLVGFAGASFYRQNFRCPRCHQFFFRRFMLVDPQSPSCVNCNLDRWTGGS
jgi:hypothetical protein